MPVIWTGATSNDEINEFDHVFYSNKKVAELAASYLEKKNYRRVAIFNSHYDHPEYKERIRYFEEAVRKYDVELYKFEGVSSAADKSPAELSRELVDIYEKSNHPALDIGFFCSDHMALKFICEMSNRNKAVDFEIFGCNGDEVTLDFFASRPATIDIRLGEVAKQTVRRLISRIDNYRKPMATTEIFIEPKIIQAEKN